ncbi:MAG: SprT family protein [Streptococcaceae bacterium]|jgi:SprT-like protein|nr:SprT family protein [Streptococcaceae bacterium]
MTSQELTEFVNRLSLTYFERPFLHTARWNSRLRTTGGRFFPKDKHLDFNPKMAGDALAFKKIVLHELCHYHLYLQHKGYQHKDADFKQLLEKVGGSRFAPQIAPRKINHLYGCKTCGQTYPRTRRINTRVMRCGKCHGKLVEIQSTD